MLKINTNDMLYRIAEQAVQRDNSYLLSHNIESLLDSFVFQVAIGSECYTEKIEVEDWGIECEDWFEMDPRKKRELIESKFSEWAYEWLSPYIEANCKCWIKGSVDNA